MQIYQLRVRNAALADDLSIQESKSSPLRLYSQSWDCRDGWNPDSYWKGCELSTWKLKRFMPQKCQIQLVQPLDELGEPQP